MLFLALPKHVFPPARPPARPRLAGWPAFFISTFGHSCISGLGLSHIISSFWPYHIDFISRSLVIGPSPYLQRERDLDMGIDLDVYIYIYIYVDIRTYIQLYLYSYIWYMHVIVVLLWLYVNGGKRADGKAPRKPTVFQACQVWWRKQVLFLLLLSSQASQSCCL